jgi:long-chain fatty acid transport protein
MKSRLKSLTLYLIFLLLLPKVIIAGGTSFTSIFGSRTLSLNGLYIAGIDGLNCTWNNPAGLAFLTGREISISFLDRTGQQQFESSSAGLRRSFRNDDLSLAGGLYYNIVPGITAALGYNKIIDYSVDWPYALYRKVDTLSAIATFDFTNNLKVNAISPSVALAFGNVALGLTLNAYYIAQYSTFPINNSRWTSGRGLVAYQYILDQNAWAFGFNLGLMTNLSDKIRIGLSARSAAKASLKGSAKTLMFAQVDSSSLSSINTSGDFKLPWVLAMGLIYKASELAINIDASLSLWKSIRNNYMFSFQNQFWQRSLSTFDSLTGVQGANLNFSTRNSIEAGIGIEYGSDQQGYSFRFGYRFSQSPLSPSSLSMLFPLLDQHWFSIGLGYKGEDYYIDAAFAYVIGVNKDVLRYGIPDLSGTYKTNGIIPSITLHFGL